MLAERNREHKSQRRRRPYDHGEVSAGRTEEYSRTIPRVHRQSKMRPRVVDGMRAIIGARPQTRRRTGVSPSESEGTNALGGGVAKYVAMLESVLVPA